MTRSSRRWRSAQAAGRSSPDDKPTPTTVLLISDGKEDGGTSRRSERARRRSSAACTVNTVALGTADGVVEVPSPADTRPESRCRPTRTRCSAIAQTTGGRFFAVPTAEQLQEVYADLASQLGKEKEWREVTVAFAGAGAVLLLVGGALSAAWFRRLP